jgi:hypothetical protein
MTYCRILGVYGQYRAISNGKSATGADDIEVQAMVGDEWVAMKTFNSISDDYAYLNAREWAERLAQSAKRRAAPVDAGRPAAHEAFSGRGATERLPEGHARLDRGESSPPWPVPLIEGTP